MLTELFGKNMNKLGSIYYIGPFDFPNGGAAARRILGNIITLSNYYDVVVIDGKNINAVSNELNIQTISVGERPKNNDGLITKCYKFITMGKKTVNYLEGLKENPKAIILYSGYTPYLLRLQKFCKKNDIKIFFDCVEWYQPPHKIQYLYNPYYWNIEFAMRFLIHNCDGIICISNYLEKYYRNKKVEVLRLPPTLDIEKIEVKNCRSIDKKKPIKLVYCGNPGHKDNLESIIRVVERFKGIFHLHVAGVSSNNTGNVSYYGYLEYNKSVELLQSCHFSILLRKKNKVSQAGFSTKVVESMSYGVPVITNNTGDLAEIIDDHSNGFIFDGVSESLLSAKLNQICCLNNDDYRFLSNAARKSAEYWFDCNKYKDVLHKFIR